MKSWKQRLFVLGTSMLLASSVIQPIAAEEEVTISSARTVSFNYDWRFHKGDGEYSLETFDDALWGLVNTPHSTIEYTPENYYQKDLGVYWYRKHFETPDMTENQRALVTFEGAMQAAEVWLNGTKVGSHQGGYTEFTLDLSDALNAQGDNVLAVRLDTRPDASFAPGKTNPDFQYFGGLYREVSLHIVDPVTITQDVDPSTAQGGGQFVQSTTVTKEKAVLQVRTQLENTAATAGEAQVDITVTDPSGTVAAQKSYTASLDAEAKTWTGADLEIENPSLWSLNTPWLYTITTTVRVDGAQCSSREMKYGIRKVEWTHDGCFINGELVDLVGTNLHSETLSVGNAQSREEIFAEIKRLRELGFNFIRMSHYPHDRSFYEACDQYGVAVLDCLAGWQNFANTDAFKNSCYAQIREMVQANRNYASVVAWEPSLNESGYNDEFARTADAVTKEEYPQNGDSRAWTGGWKYWNRFDIGIGTPQANVGADSDNAANAEKPIIVSEYGDWNMGGFNSTSRVTREDAHISGADGGDSGMLTQADNIQSSYAWNKRHSGLDTASAYWQYSDYAGFDTAKLTYCGVVDLARNPKHGAYFYQSQRDPDVDLSAFGLDSGPMIYIANNWQADSPDQVRIYSNCDEVELFLDGVSLGKQSPDTTMYDPRANYSDSQYGSQPGGTSGGIVSTEGIEHPPFTFDLSGRTIGQGDLKAVGYIDGQAKAETLRTEQKAPAAVQLSAENADDLPLDGISTRLVTVAVVDENNQPVTSANDEIEFTVEGPGYVVGADTVSVRGGLWAVLVRSQRSSSNQQIVVHASASGLNAGSVMLNGSGVSGLPLALEGSDQDWFEYEEPAERANLALNKPASADSVNTAASGSLEKAEYANDGNESTKWCAKVTNSSDNSFAGQYWWQVDLEGAYTLEDAVIVFDAPGGYRFAAAVSNDETFEGVSLADLTEYVEESGRAEIPVSGTGRYVRIYLNCPKTNVWPCLREVEIYGHDANLALNKPVTTDKSQNGQGPELAVDGDMSTYWCRAAQGPGQLTVDLEQLSRIDSVQVGFVWADTSDNGIIRHSYDVEVSADGETWMKIGSYDDSSQNDNTANALTTVELEAFVEARYLRVSNLQAYKQSANNQKQWVEIAEIKAYGEVIPVVEEELTRLDYNANVWSSSNAEGVLASYVNDGNPLTFWKADPADEKPSWTMDTGGLYKVRTIDLYLDQEAEFKAQILTSTDRVNWTAQETVQENTSASSVRYTLADPAARFVMIVCENASQPGFWIDSRGLVMNPAWSVEEAGDLTISSAWTDDPSTIDLPSQTIASSDQGLVLVDVEWNKTPESISEEKIVFVGSVKVMPGLDAADKTLQLSVNLEPRPVVLDDEVLQTVIDEAETIVKDFPLETLDAARNVLENAESQQQINDAARALGLELLELRFEPDKDLLESL